MTNFRLFQIERVSRPKFKILLNKGGEFSSWVENAVGKGEIAHDEQFLLFPTVFPNVLYCRQVKTKVYLGKY